MMDKAVDVDRYVFAISQRHGGGAERAITNFANAISNCGQDVHFVQLFSEVDDYELNESVQVHLVKQPQIRNKVLRRIKHCFLAAKTVRELKGTYVIPMLEVMEYICSFSTFFTRSALIYTIRNNPAEIPKKRPERIFRNILAMCSCAVFTQNSLEKNYFPGFMRKKIFIVPNIVDKKFTDKNIHEIKAINRVITAGRLNVQKNHEMLIRAFQIVLRERPNQRLELHIYGSGPLEQKLKQLIDDTHLNDSVFLTGRSDNIEAEYASSDLFVLSSQFEGMPNALMEAMAVGMPCIATDCESGPSDLITNNVNGILVKNNDEKGMANAIIYMIDNPLTARDYGKNAKEFISENFSSEKIADLLMKECKKYAKNR